jgi:hypothetical protein
MKIIAVETQRESRANGAARFGAGGLAEPSAAYLKFLHHKRQILFRNFK